MCITSCQLIFIIHVITFSTVYGPRGRPDMAPYKFISRVTTGAQIEQYGDGTTSRDYTYIDDIVDGVVRAIDRVPIPMKYSTWAKDRAQSWANSSRWWRNVRGRRRISS